MDNRQLITALGFSPKENAVGILIKKYQSHENYCVEVDFDKETINYGNLITVESKTTQNFSQPENFVVLECVDRLLTKGYKPQNLILEKTWGAGHGTSGRLDICVTREDRSEYLLIECKTYGKEFDKELTRMNKDGGQLFTYFKFSNKPDVIMLYASELRASEVVYRNEIVKIEEDYRTGDVKDFYRIWDKKTHQNIIWENLPYNSDARKSFTKKDLRELDEQGSKKIFNEFASILRKHSVSDKPNAFNKIFNLFLAKLFDEAKKESDELEFHWREDDNAVDFQVRLINLHKDGLFAFLQKEIEGIQDADFGVITSHEELQEKKKKLLKFNNVFAIKDVLDDASFDENQRVLKDVVQLLEKYQIRYPRKQQHLSDFFELLLTTGLKQEVGQYFTPPPITKFIVRSLPIKQMIEREVNKEAPELPAIIDYAAGSGHFITEAMEEYQDIINSFTKEKTVDFYPKAKKQIASWQADPYEWAAKYVYGVEKDYRLVKVAKVGCYFYGDGVAQIIHGDGLDNFTTSKTYKGLLKDNTNLEDSSKAKFSLVLSNPPYSVNDCKDDLEYIGAQNIFTLYSSLSDKSKEIECLFVERTKQLLKDGGVAAIILPSSILSNAGIYTKTREIILQYFDIVAIAELGGGTFMATNTNTVTLFLRRRDNQTSIVVKNYVNKFSVEYIDNTINKIERPVSKYVSYVWEGISFEDYITLLKNTPNKAVESSELYNEYRKKIKAKTEKEFWSIVLERESEKLYYFLLTYTQTVVIVKSGDKDAEKRFLGYKFLSRRGSEGIHAIQRGKTIDECTKLFDAKVFNNPERASTYIYEAFLGHSRMPIHETISKNVFRANLVDMITFDRVDFEKSISLSVKKKVKIESKWGTIRLGDILFEQPKSKIQVGQAKDNTENGVYPFFTSGESILEYSEHLVSGQNIFLSTGGNAVIKFYDGEAAYSTDTFVVKSNDESSVTTKFLFYFLESIVHVIDESYFKGVGLRHLQKPDFRDIRIPCPPKDIQAKIVAEIEKIENRNKAKGEQLQKINNKISEIINKSTGKYLKLHELTTKIGSGATPRGGESSYFKSGISLIRSQNIYDSEFRERGLVFIDKEQATKLNNVSVEEKDILFNITGASVCRCCMMDISYLPARVNQHVAIIRVNSRILPLYLQKVLVSSKIKNELLSMAENSSTREAITKKQLEEFRVPVPTIAEQQKLVAEIEVLEKQIAEDQKVINSSEEYKNAVLKKYL